MDQLTEWVTRARQGDSDAYEQVVRRFQDMAMGYAFAMLGDAQQAEDVAQEAFISAYYTLPTLRDPAAFPGWFRRIVFTGIYRHKRQRQTASLDDVPEMAARVPGPAEAIEQREMVDGLFSAINDLPEQQRCVVLMYYMDEYSQREIADFLEIPLATVKTRLHHARKHLKANLQEKEPMQRPSTNNTFTEKVMRLFKATQSGDIDNVRKLLAEDDSLARASTLVQNALWGAEANALHLAVMAGRKDIVDLLLAHGADINARDPKYQFSALHHAIDLGAFIPEYAALNMVDFLLSRGAVKDVWACWWMGDIDGAKALLDQNPALVNEIGPGANTLLSYAWTVEQTQMLLDYGTDMFKPLSSPQGYTTPLRMIAYWFRRKDILQFLLDRAGMPFDIHMACLVGDEAQVEVMLQADPALVHARTGPKHVAEPNLTPLHLAAQSGHEGIVKLLLEGGADVNAKGFDDLTPLHLVIWRGPKKMHDPLPDLTEMMNGVPFRSLRTDIPRLLLEHGADVHAKDAQRGLTPLGWAETNLEDETDRSEVVALLRSFGAAD